MITLSVKNKIIELRNLLYESKPDQEGNYDSLYLAIVAVSTIPLSLLLYIVIPTLFPNVSPVLNILVKLCIIVPVTFIFLIFFLIVVFDSFVLPLYRWVKKEIKRLKCGYEVKPKWKKNETLEQKFKRVWEDKILTMCDSVRYMDVNGDPTKILTSCVQVLNKEGLWLLEYDPSGKNKYFWYSHHRVYVLLEKEVSSDSTIFQGLMASWVEDTLGIQGAIPLPLRFHQY